MIELRTLGLLEVQGSDGRELHTVLAQPKRLALLVYLALARPRPFHRRDAIVALFWPELDQDRARGALRVALRFLRRQLGEGVLVSRTEEELGVNAEALRCDALAFEQACEAGQLEEALALHRGDFLEGLFIADASPELERWMDTERARLRTCAARAAWQLTERHFDRGNPVLAADWARRAVQLSPDDEEAQRRLITLLDRAGDRAGAVHAYEAFARHLAEDHEVEPSAETQALIRAIRLRETPSPPVARPAPPTPVASSGTAGRAPAESRDLLESAVGRAKPLRRQIVATAVAGGVGGLALVAATLLLVARVDTRSSATGPVTAKSVAVLPFVSLSSSPENEYLSDGMSEELIDALSKVGQLRVTARTSSFAFKGKNEDVRQIGNALNVGTVLAGSVRRVGMRLRVTAQLTDVVNGYVMWSDTYDREMGDVFVVQDEIVRAIVDALRIKLTGSDRARIVVPVTQDLETYSLYLKGRFYWNRRGRWLRPALESFQQAVTRDSSFAAAYAGMADAYVVMANWGYLTSREGYEPAKVAALRAVALDPGLAEAHASLAWIKCMYDWDWPAAESEFRRAIELNPGLALGHWSYANCLIYHRRAADALAEAIRAQLLDPLNRNIAGVVARAYWIAHRYDEAIAVLRKSSQEPEPDLSSVHFWLALVYLGSGRAGEALGEARKTRALAEGSSGGMAVVGYVAARVGEMAEARRMLASLKQRPRENRAFLIAMVYTGLGNKDQTFRWLNRAYDERSDLLVWLALPIFDPFRLDPRFAGLVKKIGLD